MKCFNHHFSTFHQMNDIFFFFFFSNQRLRSQDKHFQFGPNSHFHSLKIGSAGQIFRGIKSASRCDKLVRKFYPARRTLESGTVEVRERVKTYERDL